MAAILENGCHKKQLIPWAEKRIIIDDPTSPRSLALGLQCHSNQRHYFDDTFDRLGSIFVFATWVKKFDATKCVFQTAVSWVGVVCEQAYVRAWNIDVIDGKAFIIGVKGRASLTQTETRERYPRGCEDARILNVTSLFTSRETTATRVILTICLQVLRKKKNYYLLQVP